MGYTKEQRIINNLSGSSKTQRANSSKNPVSNTFILPNKSGDHIRSIKRDAPINDYDLVNKEYVDGTFLKLDTSNNPLTGSLKIDRAGGNPYIDIKRDGVVLGEWIGSVEGTTGSRFEFWTWVDGGAFTKKFTVGASNLVANCDLSMNTSNKIVSLATPTADYDAATKKYVDDQFPVDISSDTNLVAGTNITLAGDTLNVDDAFLKNDQVDEGVGLTLTGDNSSADAAYVPMVLYNTDATPPAASGFPIGTIYIQYTA